MTVDTKKYTEFVDAVHLKNLMSICISIKDVLIYIHKDFLLKD